MYRAPFLALALLMGCVYLPLSTPPDAQSPASPEEFHRGPPGFQPPTTEELNCELIPLANASWDLCFASTQHCEATFGDGAGCAEVCAAAGLACTAAYENRDGLCAPNLDLPTLSCDSGHQSDYCVCGAAETPVVEDPGPGRIAGLMEERAGFGRETEGGDPSKLYIVSTLADSGSGSLRAALESSEPWSIVFSVDGLIRWETDVLVESYKTVDGRGSDITVDGTWRLEDVHDVIISDLTLTRSIRDGEQSCEQDGDVIDIRGEGGPSPSDFTSHDIWLHHIAFRDGGDGLLDIRGGTNITVSWSHFSDHKKVTLAWQDSAGQATPGMQVTWHHNHFDHTTVRNPRFHYGRAHYVNNFVDEWWQSGAASYDQAQFYSEANIYLAADDCYGIPGVSPCEDQNPCAVNNDWFVDRSLALIRTGSSAPGFIKSTGDLLLNGAQIETHNSEAVFDPAESYSFAVEPATELLAELIKEEAGPRRDWPD